MNTVLRGKGVMGPGDSSALWAVDDYSLRLRSRVVRSIRAGVTDFPSLVALSNGADPIAVLGAIESLGNDEPGIDARQYCAIGTIKKSVVIAADADRSESPAIEGGVDFPDPHPLDFDWRFTAHSRSVLRDVSLASAGRTGRVILLGVPTLLEDMASVIPDTVLIDQNKATIHALIDRGHAHRVHCADILAQNTLAAPCDIVIADPPWYLEFYRAFICQASRLLQGDGILALSVLPLLTRPCAVRDREEILQMATEAGFHLVSAEAGRLGYQTPAFERATFKTHGISISNWRRGDLFLFLRVGAPRSDGPARTAALVEGDWDTYQIERSQIKVRRRVEHAQCRFAATPLGRAGSVLESVSRRLPVRARIDVWSSNNAAYAIQGLHVLRAALSAARNGGSPSAAEIATLFSLSVRERSSLELVVGDLVS
jgi:hypothetical protein